MTFLLCLNFDPLQSLHHCFVGPLKVGNLLILIICGGDADHDDDGGNGDEDDHDHDYDADHDEDDDHDHDHDDDDDDEKDDEETSMIVGAEQMLRLGEGGATRFWSSKALQNYMYRVAEY